MTDPYRMNKETFDSEFEPKYGWIGFVKFSKAIYIWVKSVPNLIWTAKKYLPVVLPHIIVHLFFPLAVVIQLFRTYGGEPKEKHTACNWPFRAIDNKYAPFYAPFLVLWGLITIFLFGSCFAYLVMIFSGG